MSRKDFKVLNDNIHEASRDGNLEYVKYCIGIEGIDINSKYTSIFEVIINKIFYSIF